jgi:hypothetical protein
MLSFGQPLGAIMQIGYIVKNLDAALEHWITKLNVGPFFVFEKFSLLDSQYRGRPAEFDLNLAMAFSGTMCIELIAQNDKSPSVYTEVVDLRGFGFHHLAVSTRDFDGEVARHKANGAEMALYGFAEVGARAAYMDTLSTLGGMTELIEINPLVEDFFSSIKRPSVDWRGDKPVRGPADL